MDNRRLHPRKPASRNNVVFTFSHVAVYTLGDTKVLVRQTWGAATFSGVGTKDTWNPFIKLKNIELAMNQQFKNKLHFHSLNDCLMRASEPVLDYPIMDHTKNKSNNCLIIHSKYF